MGICRPLSKTLPDSPRQGMGVTRKLPPGERQSSVTPQVTPTRAPVKMRLTVKTVEAVRPGADRREVPDGLMPGLYLIVQPSGARSWAVRYRHQGIPRKHTLGRYPAVDLKAARTLAGKALRAVAEGRDPGREKIAARAAKADSVDRIVEEFLERHVRRSNRPRTAQETERLLRQHALPRWRGRVVREITRRDVLDVLDRVVDGGAPIAANRVLAAGQRRDEVARMRWDEIDIDNRLWTLAPARVKNNQFHEIPLSPAALAILKSVPRVAGSPFVLTNGGASPASGYSKGKRRLDALLPADMPPWRLHDLRRTCASGLARLGINLPVIEKVLNHASGSFAGIVGVYQKHSFADEKRAALEAWGRHIDALVSGKPAKVVRLRGQR